MGRKGAAKHVMPTTVTLPLAIQNNENSVWGTVVNEKEDRDPVCLLDVDVEDHLLRVASPKTRSGAPAEGGHKGDDQLRNFQGLHMRA